MKTEKKEPKVCEIRQNENPTPPPRPRPLLDQLLQEAKFSVSQ